MAARGITREELVEAIREARQPPEREPGVFTRRELQVIWGIRTKNCAYDHIHELCDAGVLQRTKAMVRDGWGDAKMTKCYRFVGSIDENKSVRPD